jgi:hypothetical protein
VVLILKLVLILKGLKTLQDSQFSLPAISPFYANIFQKIFTTSTRVKKDKAGVSFEQMILSGAQNIDSGIGLYAGSHDSYTTFSDLFDKVIEDYHGHKKDGKHISNMDHK